MQILLLALVVVALVGGRWLFNLMGFCGIFKNLFL
jgi:hypothetical protein